MRTPNVYVLAVAAALAGVVALAACPKSPPPPPPPPDPPPAVTKVPKDNPFGDLEDGPPAIVGSAPVRVPGLDEGDVFGVGAAFQTKLAAAASATTDDLRKMSPPDRKLDFDPMTAKHMELFVAPKDGYGALDDDETASLKANGFVVTGRAELASDSFTDAYSRIFVADQPVFITADSVLHAWHKSYDTMLEQLEGDVLARNLDALLTAMASQVKGELGRTKGTPYEKGAADADVFVAVARSLLAGKPVASSAHEDDVKRILDAVAAEKVLTIDMFGRERKEDFSQMKPRGHYEKTDALKRYFRAMMWCGRTDMSIAGPGGTTRELAGAVVLYDLVKRANAMGSWHAIDSILQPFVGRVDSMTLTDMEGLVGKASADATKLSLDDLRAKIADSKLGAQAINSAIRDSDPLSSTRIELPRSFTLLGQRFAIDSWALGEVVYDKIVVNGAKVQRMMPTGLDVAFGVFGNNGAAADVAAAIDSSKLPYQSNLIAVRGVVDGRDASTWNDSLYSLWLSSLRGLSETPAMKTGSAPEVMQTAAWHRRVINTQLASWAELRHDTILYVKQSYGASVGCDYPDGFVEMQPAFWAAMENAAAKGAKILSTSKETLGMSAHFDQFAKTVAKLRAIVDEELAQKPMTAAELAWIKETVVVKQGGMCGAPPTFDGWYPKLFYGSNGTEADIIVADVHTSPDVGVLHEGTGMVARLVVVVDSGKDKMAFGGPVMSHYEFVPEGHARLSDHEWEAKVSSGQAPPRPPWTKGWFVH